MSPFRSRLLQSHPAEPPARYPPRPLLLAWPPWIMLPVCRSQALPVSHPSNPFEGGMTSIIEGHVHGNRYSPVIGENPEGPAHL